MFGRSYTWQLKGMSCHQTFFLRQHVLNEIGEEWLWLVWSKIMASIDVQFSGLRIGYKVEIQTYGIALWKKSSRIIFTKPLQARRRLSKKSNSHIGMGNNLSFA